MSARPRKVCNVCGVEKAISSFYRHAGCADGRMRRCKVCHAEMKRENYELKREQYREYDQARWRDPDIRARKKALSRAYAKTDAGKAAHRRATRWWRLTHPEAYAAQKARSAAALRAKRAAESAARRAAQATKIERPRSLARRVREISAPPKAANPLNLFAQVQG